MVEAIAQLVVFKKPKLEWFLCQARQGHARPGLFSIVLLGGIQKTKVLNVFSSEITFFMVIFRPCFAMLYPYLDLLDLGFVLLVLTDPLPSPCLSKRQTCQSFLMRYLFWIPLVGGKCFLGPSIQYGQVVLWASVHYGQCQTGHRSSNNTQHQSAFSPGRSAGRIERCKWLS